jgi:cell division protein FtsI (penicillin-binding protein 3)
MPTSPNRSYSRIYAGATILLFAILFARIAYIVLGNGTVRKVYHNPEVAETVVRGTIYDRNGRILAIETPYYGLYFHLAQIDDIRQVAKTVSPYIGMDPDMIVAQAGKYTTYAQIKKVIDDDQVEGLEEAIRQAGLARQVSVEKREGRTYPALFHAAQTIGFVDSENHGLEGIEYSQEPLLSPYPEVGSEAVTYGEEIVLTLDIDIQYLVDLQMQQIADVHDPDYAMGIVMDAKSGDILALSSYPWYDTNRIGVSTDSQRINHAVNYLYEPGSVFKIFSLASIMQAGQASLSVPFECDGSYTFDSGNGNMVTINCTEEHGTVTPETMISKSCNGAIAHWAMETDPERFFELLEKFGFDGSYDIGLPSRPEGSIADPSTWSGRSQATISFGQELSVTALHLASAATTFANDGDLLVPHLILSRREGSATGGTGNLLYEREPTVVGHVFDPSVGAAIRAYMHTATLEGGTATKAAVAGVAVGAKTGTAQIPDPVTHSYADGTVLASTLALVPADDPKYIVYIAAGNPKGSTIWGSNIAAPAIGSIIEGLVSQGKLFSSESTVR